MFKNIVNKLILLIFVIFILTACGGGKKNNSNSTDANEQPAITGYHITGNAFIGNINNATINLYPYENAIRGELIVTSNTDASGNFDIITETQKNALLVCITGGELTESFSGFVFSLTETDELCTAFNHTINTDSNIVINFYSHLAYGLSKYYVFSKIKMPIKTANETISTWLGFDVTQTSQTDVTIKSNASTLTEALRVGYHNAAVSVLADWTSKLNQRAIGNEISSMQVANIAHQDIAHDGLLDGQAVNGLATIGSVKFTSKIYRHDLALNVLIFANSIQNATNITAAQLVDSASLYNENKSAIFGTDAVISFSLNTPILKGATINSSDVLTGMREIVMSVVDIIGLSEIKYNINHTDPTMTLGLGAINFTSNGDLKNPSANLNTVNLNDGTGYTITVNAKNILGNAAVPLIINNLSISNNAASITTTSPSINSNSVTLIRGILNISAVVSDPVGIQSVSISIDGGQAIAATSGSLSNPSFDIDTATLNDGPHIFMVKAINRAGIISLSDMEYLIDNTAPKVGFRNYPDPTQTLNWNIGNHLVTAYSSDTNGLKTTTLSLSGTPNITVTGNMANDILSKTYVVSTGQPQGEKLLSIQSVDMAGGISNSSRKVMIDYTVATVSKSLIAVKPVNWNRGDLIGSWVGGGIDPFGQNISLKFSGQISDNLSGLQSYQISIDNIAIGPAISFTNYTTTDMFSRIFAPADYAEGPHTLKISVMDNSNNNTTILHRALNFDNSNPSIIIPVQSVFYESLTQSCLLTVVTSDTGGSGIASIVINGVAQTIQSGIWQFSMPLGGSTISYIVPMYYQITDRAGNVERRKIRYNTVCTGGMCRCQTDYPTGVDWSQPI